MKRTIIFALITIAWAGANAGDLNVVGNVNVASNLAASTMTLGGTTLGAWPSAAATGAVVLTTAVLDFTQPGQLFQYTLTANATWVFTNHAAGRQVWLQVAQDMNGNWNNLWPAGLLWSSGQAANVTATANHFSVISILDNGSSWLAQVEGLDYSVPCVTNCKFDGSQNYVSVGSLFGSAPSAITIEMWVNGAVPTKAANYLFSMSDTTTFSDLLFIDSAGQFGAYVTTDAGATSQTVSGSLMGVTGTMWRWCGMGPSNGCM